MITSLPTEHEIMKNWRSERPLVSIGSLAYNHEKYIEDALKGFLIQETDFPFEVIIHDDASTDNTANIIRKYEKAYPHIIKAIYQKENQFSKGVKIGLVYIDPLFQGEFTASCECDDYWTDNKKLQKCVDFLRTHSDYVACCHDVKIINHNGEEEKETPFGKYKGDLLNIDDQIKYNNIPTLSLVSRRNICPNEKEISLKLRENCKYIGDIQRKCLLLKYGKIKYFKEKMGVYRWNRKGGHSFSSQNSLLKHLDTFNAYKNVREILNYDSKLLKQKLGLSASAVIFNVLRVRNNFQALMNCIKYMIKKRLVRYLILGLYIKIIKKIILSTVNYFSPKFNYFEEK